MSDKISVFWFRRDLRLEDNAGLSEAIRGDEPVLPIFIFDVEILDKLNDPKDARLSFIHQRLAHIKNELKAMGSDLDCRYGKPIEIWYELAKEYKIGTVYTNRDYEPYAQERDENVAAYLNEKGIAFLDFKDQVIFEKNEVVKKDGLPYTVFTPYSRKWKAKLVEGIAGDALSDSPYFKSYDSSKNLAKSLVKINNLAMPSLNDMGFKASEIEAPQSKVKRSIIKNYTETRNFPALNGTSKLGVHFRFGTISIRQKAKAAAQLNDTYLNELIWRDFYSMILYHFPHVVEKPFREKYSYIEWSDDEPSFEAWKEGRTGYPLVDAGMRELNATGFMHNRVRMVVASFLTKHLLIDWRWGEAYFAEKLLDFDLASNNGGWQWAAGCGTDAAPYFRIFNPTSQMQKFDKNQEYIKNWIPEYGTDAYPEPIIDHKMARERCLERYKTGLDRAAGVLS